VLTVWHASFLHPQNFWAGYATGFTERLLRALQKVLGSRVRPSEKWFSCASGATFEVIVTSCSKRLLLRQFGGGEIGFNGSDL